MTDVQFQWKGGRAGLVNTDLLLAGPLASTDPKLAAYFESKGITPPCETGDHDTVIVGSIKLRSSPGPMAIHLKFVDNKNVTVKLGVGYGSGSTCQDIEPGYNSPAAVTPSDEKTIWGPTPIEFVYPDLDLSYATGHLPDIGFIALDDLTPLAIQTASPYIDVNGPAITVSHFLHVGMLPGA